MHLHELLNQKWDKLLESRKKKCNLPTALHGAFG